jgi:hypothetical protein
MQIGKPERKFSRNNRLDRLDRTKLKVQHDATCQLVRRHCTGNGRNAMELQLTDHEKKLLLEILQERHSNLIHEIARTDHRDFKHELQHRCTAIEGIMKKVQAEERVSA